MHRPEVAVVSRDAGIRDLAARAFERAPHAWRVVLFEDVPATADVVVYGADVAGASGIVLDPDDPEAAVAQVAARLVPAPRVVAVAGAAGGAGTSTIALHLAAQLAAARSTCVVEALPGCGMSERLGLFGKEVRTWDSIDDSDDSVLLSALPFPGGYRALLAPRPHGGDASRAVVAARRCFERVVVDLGPHPEHVPEGVGVLVMPATSTGACRARALLDRHPDVRWAVIVNRTGRGGPPVPGPERALGRRIATMLPYCPALRDAEHHGSLVTQPWSRWVRKVAALAKALEDA